MRIWSYPKIYNLGHPAIGDLFKGPVTVGEKLDGSQLSFAWTDDGLVVRSKGKLQYGPEGGLDGLFTRAVDYLLMVEPIPGYVFRAEYFTKPKHNTLAYDRMPENGIALYDVEDVSAPNNFWNHSLMMQLGERLGVSVVRDFTKKLARLGGGATDDETGELLLFGESLSLEALNEVIDAESQLGGPKMEGVVIKNYNRFTIDGKVMMGKLVSPEFKERHGRSWKERNPNRADILDDLQAALNTEARWQKAVQHLAEDGVLTGTPKDIGPLMAEVKRDTLEEEGDWIVEKLTSHFLPKVSRAIGRGLPEWYKEKLAASAFAPGEEVTV